MNKKAKKSIDNTLLVLRSWDKYKSNDADEIIINKWCVKAMIDDLETSTKELVKIRRKKK